MQAIKHLYNLQELDWKVAGAEKELAEVRARLADDSELAAARRRVEELAARLDQLSSNRREAERANLELQEKLQRVESRLYGGAVTNPRELSAAEEEHEFIGGRRREGEDRLLELMVKSEDVEAARDEAQSRLARLETEGPAEKAELLESQKRMVSELDALGQRREQIVPILSPAVLSRYDSLRKSKNGHAVAMVVRGMCQGCRLTVTTLELQRARSAQDITLCSSCHRILYAV
jgi:predicted  nucleic acid-binding Zn-ribbon protein